MKVAIIATLWLVVVWRLPAARQESWRRAFWVALAALAASLTFSLPQLGAVPTPPGIPAPATVCMRVTGVVACAAVLEGVAALTRPAVRVGRLGRVIAVIATITAVIFPFIPGRASEFPQVMVERSPLASAYLILAEAYLFLAMLTAAIMFIVAARQAGPGLLRAGLWILWSGTSLVGIHALVRSLLLVGILEGAEPPLPGGIPALYAASQKMQLIAIALIVAGSSLPAVTGALAAHRDYQDLNALRPLWSQLTSAVPYVVLGTPPRRRTDLTSAANLRVRLLRRTIEIHDARLVLRNHVREEDLAWVRDQLVGQGLSGTRLDAAVEAAWLSAAVVAHRQRRPLEAAAARFSPGGTDLASEVRWLRLVSEARRTDAVTAASADLRDRMERRR